MATRHCHLLSIDPLDENYFASAGPAGEPVVSIWDRRTLSSSSSTLSPLSATTRPGSVLEIRDAITTSPQTNANIWSLRYSGFRRGCFAVLSSQGQVRIFDTGRYTPSADSPFSNHVSLGHTVQRIPCYSTMVVPFTFFIILDRRLILQGRYWLRWYSLYKED